MAADEGGCTLRGGRADPPPPARQHHRDYVRRHMARLTDQRRHPRPQTRAKLGPAVLTLMDAI
jgi:hypothetical protein